MKLWKVNVVHELVVRAKDSKEASDYAKEAVRDHEYDNDPEIHSEEINDELDLPSSWDDACIPWGERDPERPDMTIAEILAEQKASEQQNPNQLLLPGFE